MKGIIFDMDNTLLRSNIDFARMKLELRSFLSNAGIIPRGYDLSDCTASTLIATAQSSEKYSDAIDRQMWEIVTTLEAEGMQGAELEPGAAGLLEQLKICHKLVILTNNSRSAACSALEQTGIAGMFDYIAGREQADMKPSPAGVAHILQRFPHIERDEWISVGDSWIDGKAAQDSRVAFVAYRANLEAMRRNGVRPLGYIDQLDELPKFLAL